MIFGELYDVNGLSRFYGIPPIFTPSTPILLYERTDQQVMMMMMLAT